MAKESKLTTSAVYSALMRIPCGKVATYGDIARMVGRPGASRAIGRILNKNPDPVSVPCHRVVRADGSIGGYAFGKSRKKELLESEGLDFDGDNVVGFEARRIDSARLA